MPHDESDESSGSENSYILIFFEGDYQLIMLALFFDCHAVLRLQVEWFVLQSNWPQEFAFELKTYV